MMMMGVRVCMWVSDLRCRDEKEREKDEVADDDDGCAYVYVGLGPSLQRERRETVPMREKQKAMWVSVRVYGRRIERPWVSVRVCGRMEKGEKGAQRRLRR
ncbi:hypothetical protein ACFX2I_003238 [Malus domestica]